jgi:Dyp-type peroxidase family
MSCRRHRIDRRDIQGNVLCGYGQEFRHTDYLFMRVHDARAGSRWLRELAGEVTSASRWRGAKPLLALNVALTHDGLVALGVPESVLETFPREFREGMAHPARCDKLGDKDESAPDRWAPGLRRGEPHVLVTVTARDAGAMALRGVLLRERIAALGGLDLVHEQRAGALGGTEEDPLRREHFGFADGFSQPALRGNGGPDTRRGMGKLNRRGGWSNIAPGEFVLGYAGDDGLLPEAPAAPLGRSGSFAVVRKLRQHVGRFNAYLEDQAARDLPFLSGVGDPDLRREALAARIVGRWRDGTSLISDQRPRLPARFDKEEIKGINDFRYGSDPDGVRCPLGAHVRRTNPRDSVGWRGKLTNRHRIIRRGMPYGPPGDDDRERGLMFVSYQASIARQFEVIQSGWLCDGDQFWLGSEGDYLTSGNTMTIQGPHPAFLTKREPFVTTRGGGYFFTPGLSALRALGARYWAG